MKLGLVGINYICIQKITFQLFNFAKTSCLCVEVIGIPPQIQVSFLEQVLQNLKKTAIDVNMKFFYREYSAENVPSCLCIL